MTAQDFIRNFCIIAHVDHGKSTLADRFLEITDVLPKGKHDEQFLDQNPISRERGITIKLAPVRMLWHPQILNYKHEILNKSQIKNSNDQKGLGFRNSNLEIASSAYVLNLIDTPGHVDFSYEVSRTLAACEGAVLLVDATQGIQAQTVAHFQAAKKEGLVIIPVINKIDLPNAQKELVAKELVETFGFLEEEILYISAKTGENVESVLRAIIQKIPSPKQSTHPFLRALVFDAVYDLHRGVVVFVRVVDGKVKATDVVEFLQNKAATKVEEVGFFAPKLTVKEELTEGEIGYIVTGVKDIRKTQVGDTITIQNSEIEPLPGYKKPKPMVFFGVYPKSSNDYVQLKEALSKLALADSSLSIAQEHSAFLGSGFRVGFLGILHAEIVKERLKQEAGVEPLFTQPTVLYKKENEIFLEPYMRLYIYSPNSYVGSIMQLCQKRRGKLIDVSYHKSYVALIYEIPYSIFIRGLSSNLKSVSSGFASVDYELIDFRKADLVNLEIRVNDMPVDVLSELVYRGEAQRLAREKIDRLAETLTRQQFRQIIQGVVSGQIVARAEISPLRKDVIKKLSGGDRTRKDKLLKKQKRGKEKLFVTSKVDIPQEALFSFLRGN
ncbi:MAG: elongation factor 4 [Candidatus Levybacteria bacterium]|nr:elongation factor 4 [Candidatus Levybacteria bacterium]